MSPNSIEQIMHISLCHIRKESEKLILQNANRTGVYCMIAFRLKNIVNISSAHTTKR